MHVFFDVVCLSTLTCPMSIPSLHDLALEQLRHSYPVAAQSLINDDPSSFYGVAMADEAKAILNAHKRIGRVKFDDNDSSPFTPKKNERIFTAYVNEQPTSDGGLVIRADSIPIPEFYFELVLSSENLKVLKSGSTIIFLPRDNASSTMVADSYTNDSSTIIVYYSRGSIVSSRLLNAPSALMIEVRGEDGHVRVDDFMCSEVYLDFFITF